MMGHLMAGRAHARNENEMHAPNAYGKQYGFLQYITRRSHILPYGGGPLQGSIDVSQLRWGIPIPINHYCRRRRP